MTNASLTIARIEQASLWAWPPRETRWLNGWLLRAGEAGSHRLNSAQTLAFTEPDRLARVIAEVEGWYGQRDLPACFQLTDAFQPRNLDDVLAARGYALLTPTSVLTLPLSTLPSEPNRPVLPERAVVDLETRPTQAVMNALCDPLWTGALRRERATLFARIRRPRVFALATDGGVPAAAGLCVVDQELAGIFAMRTQAPWQRRGFARAVLGRLLRWARDHGAETAYLQVQDANRAAWNLYNVAGFTQLYSYWYRELPNFY